MNIAIRTIPHAEQRYETVGDWIFGQDGSLEIRVSDMGNWKYEVLVGLHEAIEALLCHDRGITTEMVDAFDVQWEKDHPNEVQGGGPEEPGDDPDCPYRKEHFFATSVERLLAAEFGVDWDEYDSAILAL